jgi:hypothetical protein
MKTIVRDSALLIDVAAIAAGYGLAQEPFLEKHVKDIRAEATEDVIFASPLCRQANAARYHIIESTRESCNRWKRIYPRLSRTVTR